MIQAVIFDYFDTWALNPLRVPAERVRLAERLGVSAESLYEAVNDEEGLMSAGEIGRLDCLAIWRRVFAKIGLDAEREEAFYRAVDREFWGQASMTPNLPLLRLADLLRSIGIRTGLLSNTWNNIYDHWKNPRLDCRAHMDCIFLSCEMGLRKPDPKIFLAMLAGLGLEAGDVVFLDDNPQNVRAASSLGIHAVPYRSPRQALMEVMKVIEENRPNLR